MLIWQRWGWLAIGAFLVSAPQLALWAVDRDELTLPLTVLALHWCLFVVAAIGYELRVPDVGSSRVVRDGAARQRGVHGGARLAT